MGAIVQLLRDIEHYPAVNRKTAEEVLAGEGFAKVMAMEDSGQLRCEMGVIEAHNVLPANSDNWVLKPDEEALMVHLQDAHTAKERDVEIAAPPLPFQTVLHLLQLRFPNSVHSGCELSLDENGFFVGRIELPAIDPKYVPPSDGVEDLTSEEYARQRSEALRVIRACLAEKQSPGLWRN